MSPCQKLYMINPLQVRPEAVLAAGAARPWQAALLGCLYLAFCCMQLLRAWLIPSVLMRELRHPHLRHSCVVLLGVPLLSIDFMT